jgi:hypothetical protein
MERSWSLTETDMSDMTWSLTESDMSDMIWHDLITDRIRHVWRDLITVGIRHDWVLNLLGTHWLEPLMWSALMDTHWLAMAMVGQNRMHTPYERIFKETPANITVYTPYIYRIGQNRIYTPYMNVYLQRRLTEAPNRGTLKMWNEYGQTIFTNSKLRTRRYS